MRNNATTSNPISPEPSDVFTDDVLQQSPDIPCIDEFLYLLNEIDKHEQQMQVSVEYNKLKDDPLKSFDYIAYLDQIEQNDCKYSIDLKDDLVLLIFGYVRQNIENNNFEHIVPNDIKYLCANFYGKLYIDLGQLQFPDIDENEHKITEKWLKLHWKNTFLNVKNLIDFFAICRMQNIAYLPGILNDIYCEWKVLCLVDKNQSAIATPVEIGDFIRKSKVFFNLNAKNELLFYSAISEYSKVFAPRPILVPYFQINDSLYEYVKYTLIMSKIMDNAISNNVHGLYFTPIQIDLWIVPKSIQSSMIVNADEDSEDSDDSDDDSDSDSDEIKNNLDIENRLTSNNVMYHKFQGSVCKNANQIENILKDRNKTLSNNRFICLVDRSDLQIQTYLFQSPCDEKLSKDDNEYFYEHPMRLSKEYMLPPLNNNDKFNGAYHDFDSQMFMISMYYEYNDIRMRWYINGWNMRISDVNNLLKIWPVFFTKDRKYTEHMSYDKYLTKIKKELVDKYSLKIMNNQYREYKQSLLRLQT